MDGVYHLLEPVTRTDNLKADNNGYTTVFHIAVVVNGETECSTSKEVLFELTKPSQPLARLHRFNKIVNGSVFAISHS